VGAKPTEDAGCEGRGDRAILLVAVRPEDLVQGPPREPAARQYPVDRGSAERQDPMDCKRRPLDSSDALTQLGKLGSFPDHVPSLFSLKLLVNVDTVDDRAGRRLTPSVTLSPLLNAAPAIPAS